MIELKNRLSLKLLGLACIIFVTTVFSSQALENNNIIVLVGIENTEMAYNASKCNQK